MFLKLNFGTRMKQTAKFNADLLRMLEQKDWFLSKHNSLMNAFENAFKLLIGHYEKQVFVTISRFKHIDINRTNEKLFNFLYYWLPALFSQAAF